ncbi:MAG: hypothetical protein EOO39_09205 [Cytophagaceae bacterium]|nr:MAG: hypothetical protein EOO39_09205 [Cytophagaceae bacterium]
MSGLTEIKLQGHLDPIWAKSVDDMTIRYMDTVTILQVRIKDQAQLRGILNRFLDLNLTLISVNSLDTG